MRFAFVVSCAPRRYSTSPEEEGLEVEFAVGHVAMVESLCFFVFFLFNLLALA